MSTARRVLTWFTCASLSAGAVAGTALGAQDSIPGAARSLVTTRHQVTIGRRTLAYTARAGFVPIRHNDDGSIRAYAFFVAYTMDRVPGAPPRPLTFAWNGGPGANSLLLHLSAFGPRRIDVGDGGASPRTAPRLVDNAESLLPLTDLVFFDPPGTGFSRLTAPAHGPEFYGVLEDIAATREFIRVYRTRFDAWDAPVYLAGESYGTWRAMGTAEAMERQGDHVAGVILVSGGIPIGPMVSPELRAALFLPSRVSTAAWHGVLGPQLMQAPAAALREAEQWARGTYAAALARRDSLTAAERTRIVAQLGRFTGLDTALIDHHTLVVGRRAFLDNLLRGRGGGALGTFDAREVTHTPTGQELASDSARAALVERYLRVTLGVKTDLVYQGLESGYGASSSDVNAAWRWDHIEPGMPPGPTDDGPPGGAAPWTQRTLILDRSTRVFVAAGTYDSLNSCLLLGYQIALLEPDARRRITLGCYEGGHMMYEDRDARAALHEDLGRFYRGLP